MNLSITTIIALVGVATFGVLTALSALRWRSRERATLHLSMYLALGLVWCVGAAIASLNLAASPSSLLIFRTIFFIGKLALPLMFAAVTLAFLERDRVLSWHWAGSLLLIAVWLISVGDLAGLATQVAGYLPALGNIDDLAHIVAIIGWGYAMGISLVTVYLDFGRRRRQQFRNRLRYWLGATALVGLANSLLFFEHLPAVWIGGGLNIVAGVLTTYIVMRYHPPDLKVLSWRIIRFLTATIIRSLILVAAFLAASSIITNGQAIPRTALLLILGIATGLAVVLPLASTWVERLLTRILFGPVYDRPDALRQYSQTVSNALDINRLGQEALSSVLETMKVRRGALLIDEGSDEGYVNLRFLATSGVGPFETGRFSADNPVMIRLQESKAPLAQYDIDVLPQFRRMDAGEREWLATLDVELYVPVLRQRTLIGVIALGSKEQNLPYLAEDMALLETLADQMAVALDNAKLFEQLAAVKEEAGLLSERLLGFDQDKSEFLNIASHELRTPLTQIHGYASMLLEMSDSEMHDAESLRQMVEGIARGSDRMKGVVQQMLEVSEVDMGQLQLFSGPVILAQVIDQAVTRQKTALEQRQHTLAISGFDHLPTLEADGTRLVQAMEQLINNAIKYMPDGGKITVVGREVSDPLLGQAVEIIVSDAGIGIDPEDHERIFEKFYRVDDADHHSTSKVKFKGAGTGLGLPLVKGIIEAHCGRVWVQSPGYNEELCPGSQFFIRLPVSPPGDEPEMPESLVETRHWRAEEVESLRK
ncbi:MAG: ATP-binding protein [Anaerolineae bacterium]